MRRALARERLDGALTHVNRLYATKEDPVVAEALAGLAAAIDAVIRPRRRSLHVGPIIAMTTYRTEGAGTGRRDFVVLWRDFRRVLLRVPLPWVSDYDKVKVTS